MPADADRVLKIDPIAMTTVEVDQGPWAVPLIIKTTPLFLKAYFYRRRERLQKWDGCMHCAIFPGQDAAFLFFRKGYAGRGTAVGDPGGQ